MRDLFLLAVLPFLLFPAFKRPFIGVGLCIWTAMFYPNGWVYGIAAPVRFNLLFIIATGAAYLMSKDRSKVHLGPIGVLILVFFCWTTITTIVGIGDPDIQWEIWSRFSKIIMLFLFVVMIVRKKLHIDFFFWCIVFSIGFYGSLEALKYIASRGGHMIEGLPGHVLGDRNELSIAFSMTIPICFYLLEEYGRQAKIIKLGLLGMIVLLVIAIIGTQSRGGFIALSAMGAYLFMKSKRKILFAFLFGCTAFFVVGLIPQEWYARMDTIGTATSDDSFMGRVVAWKLSFIMATQHPIFGGGFKAIEYPQVWAALSQSFQSYSFFYTGDAYPDPHHTRAAHSIYFQVLGDHGFIGLAIFLSFLLLTFLKTGTIARRIKDINGPSWIFNMATMLRLSIFAYCVGAAALSFAYFELIYAISGLIIVVDQMTLNMVQEAKRKPGSRDDQSQTQESSVAENKIGSGSPGNPFRGQT